MKRIHLITALAAALAVSATNGIAKQYGTKDTDAAMDKLETSQIRRVSQESLDRMFTAKDLIGTTLYDTAGEKIGTVADVQIADLSMNTKMSQMNRDKGNDSVVDTSSVWTDKRDGAEDMEYSADHSTRGETTVYISVGGLLGIGNDIVAVPASSISYDTQKERYNIPVSKSHIVALAEQEVDADGDRTYSAKQRFDSDISNIRDAFKSADEQKDFAGIMVNLDENKVTLTGTVGSEKAKKNAEDIARKHTSMKIDNSIKIQKKNN